MIDLSKQLSHMEINVDDLFIDPNNLRLIGIAEREGNIPEDRFTDDDVQESVFQDMLKAAEADVKQMKNSIIQNGFLPMDRIVVRKIQDTENKYVVIEGNRRLAAIKSILRDQKRGVISLDEDSLRALQKIEVLLLESSPEQFERDRTIIQGIRHMVGVKNWKLYPQSLAVVRKREQGLSKKEVGEALGGLSTTMVGWLEKAYYTYQQMKDDEEFGEYLEPDMISYFLEAVKKPYVRDDFLGWDDSENKFTNEENQKLFYEWIVPKEELNGRKKIPMAIDVRKLPDILQHTDAYNTFVNTPEITIDQVPVRPPPPLPWRQEVRDAKDVLKRVPIWEPFTEEDIILFKEIENLVREIIKRIEALGKA